MTKPSTLIVLQFAALLSLIAGVLSDQIAFNAISFGILVVYGCLSWAIVKQHPASATLHADNVYFLGYMLTIIGIAAIAFRIGFNPSLIEAPTPLIQRAGIALFSTIVGLFGMMAIKNWGSYGTDSADSIDEQMRRHMRSLSRETEQLLDSLRRAREEGVKELTAQIKNIDFKSAAENFRTSLGKCAKEFSENLEASTSHVKALGEETKKLAEGATQIESSLPTLRTELEAVATSFRNHKESLETLVAQGEAAEKMSVAFETATQTVGAVSRNAQQSQKEIKDLTACIREMETAIEDFVTFTHKLLSKDRGFPARDFGFKAQRDSQTTDSFARRTPPAANREGTSASSP